MFFLEPELHDVLNGTVSENCLENFWWFGLEDIPLTPQILEILRESRASSMGLLKSEVLKNLCQVEHVLGFINPKQNIEDALNFINLF